MSKNVEEILQGIQSGDISVEDGVKALRYLPFEDLGFAKVDVHREMRRGFPEAIFGQGKTAEQVAEIALSIQKAGQCSMVTRGSLEQFEAVRERCPDAVYHERARVIFTKPLVPVEEGPEVCILSGGTADQPVAEEAALTVEAGGVKARRVYDVGVAGIHRLFHHLDVIAEAEVLIVVAGMEGALPSVVAGLVDVPVIAVPTSVGYGANFSGLAPLLAMLNSCATGVAVVNIDNGFGAGRYATLVCRGR